MNRKDMMSEFFDPNIPSGQASILLADIDSEQALVHWLWDQDFFVDENVGECGECFSDELAAHYLIEAGADNNQVDRILKVMHSND